MSIHRLARVAVSLLLGRFACGSALAQWPSDPAANLSLGDRTGEQVQAKICATSDGGCYASWFDNFSGGYDVYLQRLDPAGFEQWTHNGILLADCGFSSTEDYDLDVDADDNAILTYRDDHTGTVRIVANKVDSLGTPLWGPFGVQVSVSPDVHTPRVCATSSGNVVVGWSVGNGFRLQKLDASGTPQWGAEGLLLQPSTGSYFLSDLVASDGDNVIALWVRPIGNFLSDKHLYTQKFDGAGNALWDRTPGTPASKDPIIVYDGGSVQNGYFPAFVSDQAGGGVYGWYEISGNRHAYVQRVTAAGAELFAHNGVACSTTAGRIQLSPSVAFAPLTGETFLAWTEANSLQSQWGISAQKYSAAGARDWGNGGRELLPLSTVQNGFVTALEQGGELIVAAFSAFPGRIIATRRDTNGNAVWTPAMIDVCSTVSGKDDLEAAQTDAGMMLFAWTDDRRDAGNIYAQNLNPDGSLGVPGCPGDLDGDGDVDLADLSALLTNYGTPSGADPGDGDLDGDGDVDLADLSALLENFGAGCA
ncbi:MAG: hypothetical protein HRF50_16825 [Phycisphaerae bacterium]|jgi:hypothetical protein